jgi:hypothetical protein
VPFAQVRARRKTCEIRREDRAFETGDVLVLKEWDPVTETYSGEVELREVMHVTHGGEWGLPPGLCVMSIRPH